MVVSKLPRQFTKLVVYSKRIEWNWRSIRPFTNLVGTVLRHIQQFYFLRDINGSIPLTSALFFKSRLQQILANTVITIHWKLKLCGSERIIKWDLWI